MQQAASAGQLRFKVRFDKKVELKTAEAGGSVTAWSEMGTGSFIRSADIRPLRGGESVHAQRLQGEQSNLIIVRHDMNTRCIDPSWRAVELLNGIPQRYFGIRDAGDMERQHLFITLFAVIGDPDGGDNPATN